MKEPYLRVLFYHLIRIKPILKQQRLHLFVDAAHHLAAGSLQHIQKLANLDDAHLQVAQCGYQVGVII